MLSQNIFNHSPEVALEVRDKIITKCTWLSTHSMTGSRIEGLGKQYKLGYAVKTTYKIYYQILGKDHIKILMVRDSRRRNLTPNEIRNRA